MMPERARAAYELLAFYGEAGIDVALGEETNDFLSPPAARAVILPEISSPPRRGSAGSPDGRIGSAPNSAPVAPEAAVMAAREMARKAASLDALREIMQGFDGCALKSTATQLVFADGDPKSRLMLVGEAPGYEEDKRGLPFV